MKIEYLHASRFGNGAKVAEEFKRVMSAKGNEVEIQHMRDAEPNRLPRADLYVFSSPGRMGKPSRRARRFLEKLELPAGTKVAILTTEGAPRPDKKTGKLPTEEERAKYEHVRPIMSDLLASKQVEKVAEEAVFVNGMRGPLEDGWEKKVEHFAAEIPSG